MVAPTPDYREAGQLLSAYGVRLGQEGDDASAQRALAIAMTIAEHEGDLTLEMVTLIHAASVAQYHLRLEESGEKGLRAIELMERLDNPVCGHRALVDVLRVYYNSGELREAQRYATRLLRLAESTGDPNGLAFALYCNAKIAALGGDWTSARQFCDRGVMENPQAILLFQVRALLEYTTGDFEQGEAHLQRVIQIYHAAGPEPDWTHVITLQTIAAVSHMAGTTRHFDVAQAAAQIILGSQRVNPLWVWFARTGLALVAAQLGDTRTVRKQYQAVRGQRGNLMAMDIDRLLGLVASVSGEWDDAAAYFEAALTTWGKGRYPQYAWAAYEYADMLFQRGNQGVQEKINRLLDEALSISHELGMVPLTERVLLRNASINTQ